MRNKTIKIISALALSSIIFSCNKNEGNNDKKEYERSVVNFKGISINVPGQVTIKKSEQYHYKMTVQSNIESVITTQVKDSILYIDYKNGAKIGDHADLNINITTPELIHVVNNSRSNIDIDTFTSLSKLSTEINGSGNVNIDYVSASVFHFTLLGHGDLILNYGQLDYKDLSLGGTGLVRSDNVSSKVSSIQIQGKGDVYTNTSDSLYIRISGNGNVYYKGDPKINISAIGSGTAIPL